MPSTKTRAPEAEWLDKEAAAAYLGITPRNLRARMEDGTLSYTRMGPRLIRFRRSDLDEFAERGRVEADG